ncbi:hypothetical protein [Larkinella terrae]|uniref:Uncharacterized protein n=1 Tax=Larkinella terrae TaxID=2025311 RepID=A0A7K0ELI7_9BACT|nr:hypothetical protein [Larkinella terrae]MRS62723.1 hypothetical protein [Larkinella terrae]
MALFIILSNVTNKDVALGINPNGWIKYFQSYEEAQKYAEQNQLGDYNIFKKENGKPPKKKS